MAINAANTNGITITLAAFTPANTITNAAKITKLRFTPVKLAKLRSLKIYTALSVYPNDLEMRASLEFKAI